MTTSAYKGLTESQQIFKDLLWTPSIRLGLLSLKGYLPFLNWPFVSQIVDSVVHYVSEVIFNGIALLIDVTAIKLLNAEHQREYDNASLALAVVAQEKGISSEEFKKAREAAKLSLSRFTQLPH
jgi:hypothetical protein